MKNIDGLQYSKYHQADDSFDDYTGDYYLYGDGTVEINDDHDRSMWFSIKDLETILSQAKKHKLEYDEAIAKDE